MSNIVTNDEIISVLESDWREAIAGKDIKTMLGAFVVGKANFGYAMSAKDIETVIIHFPSVEEIATNSIENYYKIRTGGRKVNFLDFRILLNSILDLDSNIEEIFFTEYSIINPMYQKLFFELRKNNLTPVQKKTACENIKEEGVSESFYNGIVEIFKQYLTMKENTQEKFFDAITKTEEKALIHILETIGDEGTISISEAIKKSGISRPVFTSLFDKLDKYKGAEIRNMGVKGTYINFYDHILSAFEIK